MTWRLFLSSLLTLLLMAATTFEASPGDLGSVSQPPSGGATAAATASNIVYVPGKAIVCGTSGVLWFVAMLLTFGALYQESADFVKGGCGGRWVLTGEDFTSANGN